MDSEEHCTAAERVTATHLSMFNDSCVLKAVETWRIWNEFPDQHTSSEFHEALTHFGQNAQAVLDEISVVMAHLLAAPGTTFDDSFILRILFSHYDQTGDSCFLFRCVLSSIMLKSGDCNVRYSPFYQSINNCTLRTTHIVSGCSSCRSPKLMQDLGAYIARRHLQSM
jgi:hypothetical protein